MQLRATQTSEQRSFAQQDPCSRLPKGQMLPLAGGSSSTASSTAAVSVRKSGAKKA